MPRTWPSMRLMRLPSAALRAAVRSTVRAAVPCAVRSTAPSAVRGTARLEGVIPGVLDRLAQRGWVRARRVVRDLRLARCQRDPSVADAGRGPQHARDAAHAALARHAADVEGDRLHGPSFQG